jgi:hypothetical protein
MNHKTNDVAIRFMVNNVITIKFIDASITVVLLTEFCALQQFLFDLLLALLTVLLN